MASACGSAPQIYLCFVNGGADGGAGGFDTTGSAAGTGTVVTSAGDASTTGAAMIGSGATRNSTGGETLSGLASRFTPYMFATDVRSVDLLADTWREQNAASWLSIS